MVVPLFWWHLLQLHSFCKQLNFYRFIILSLDFHFTYLSQPWIDQQPAINVLKEINVFMEANPSAVITIFIEDYVTSPKGLTKVFNASGLFKYWFPVSRMPKNGGDWPLLTDMISSNQRLVVFTSKQAKESSEGIAYEWRYVVENQCTDIYYYLYKLDHFNWSTQWLWMQTETMVWKQDCARTELNHRQWTQCQVPLSWWTIFLPLRTW